MSEHSAFKGLVVRDLSYSYGTKKALDRISFDIVQGTFCALLGPNGAGKSTLFALLTRMFVAQSGNIDLAGIPLDKKPRLALARLGVVFQQPTLDLDLTVQQNLIYFSALHGLSAREAAPRIDACLERLGMRSRKREKVRTLNGGHRRRMEIARALIHRPDILLMDEPTVGLDAATRAAITTHVHELSADDGITVLWATHLVDEVRPRDRLIVLHQGRIIADGFSEALCNTRTLAETFADMTGTTNEALA